MLKITSQDRFVTAPPNQGWSLERGANHFDETPPDAVVKKLLELVAKGFVKTETLDADANSTPWPAPEAAVSKKS